MESPSSVVVTDSAAPPAENSEPPAVGSRYTAALGDAPEVVNP